MRPGLTSPPSVCWGPWKSAGDSERLGVHSGCGPDKSSGQGTDSGQSGQGTDSGQPSPCASLTLMGVSPRLAGPGASVSGSHGKTSRLSPPGNGLGEFTRFLQESQEVLVDFMVISKPFIKDSLLQCKAPKYGIFKSQAGMWPSAWACKYLPNKQICLEMCFWRSTSATALGINSQREAIFWIIPSRAWGSLSTYRFFKVHGACGGQSVFSEKGDVLCVKRLWWPLSELRFLAKRDGVKENPEASVRLGFIWVWALVHSVTFCK